MKRSLELSRRFVPSFIPLFHSRHAADTRAAAGHFSGMLETPTGLTGDYARPERKPQSTWTAPSKSLQRRFPLDEIVRTVRVRGGALMATEQPIGTSTAAGKCFLDMLGVFAEFETNLRRERQLEGIAKAKAEGVYKGRPAPRLMWPRCGQ